MFETLCAYYATDFLSIYDLLDGLPRSLYIIILQLLPVFAISLSTSTCNELILNCTLRQFFDQITLAFFPKARILGRATLSYCILILLSSCVLFLLKYNQARSYGVAYATPGLQDPSFLPPLGNPANFVCGCFFVAVVNVTK